MSVKHTEHTVNEYPNISDISNAKEWTRPPVNTQFDLNHRVIAILGGDCIRNNPKLLELEELLIERLRTMEPLGLNNKNSQRV